MAKNIILTSKNKGIALINMFIDENKKPINITNYISSVDIVFPSGSSKTYPLELIDALNGKVVLILGEEQTTEIGLYKLYFNLYDNDSYITAQNMITYYVISERGGA